MLSVVSVVEWKTPLPKDNHGCYFVSAVDELRAGRTFECQGVVGRIAAVQFMWKTIEEAIKGKHQDDDYGKIISQKIFVVELSSPEGEDAFIVFANVGSQDECDFISQCILETLRKARN